jgi:hypothetical protein
MTEKIFPKLSQYKAVESSWDDAKRADPRKRTNQSIGGLLPSEGDPPDLEILLLIDAAFRETMFIEEIDTWPEAIAKRLGKEGISFSEYLVQLRELGLDPEILVSKSMDMKSDYLKSKDDSKKKAIEFFELIKSEWHVTDDQVRDHLDSTTIYELLEIVLSHADEVRARLSAMARHEKTNKAKEFVVAEWQKHREQYGGNKSAFARDYSARVRNEFVNAKGEPLDIKEKTIRELWLSDTPNAGR